MAIRVVTSELPKNLIQQWNFALEVDGFDVAYFTKADRPKAEFDEVEFNPAGSHRPEKAAGRLSFEDLNFERGVPAEGADEEVLAWMSEAIDFVRGEGLRTEDYMRDVGLVEYDRAGNVAQRWTLHGAWIKSFDGGELDGSSSDNVIETLTICYQFFTRS